MKSEIKLGLIAVASLLLGAGCAWFFFGSDKDDLAMSASEKGKFAARISRNGSVKKITEISVDRVGDRKSVRIVESEAVRPNVLETAAADVNDEEKLNDMQKSVLKEIQAALDADDVKALRKALSRFTASVKNGGLGGYENVPRSIRAAAVQALGWFGKDALDSLIDFTSDSDETIASDAFNNVELALEDVSMSDRDRAAGVKRAAREFTDSDKIDSILSALNNMRNSVKAETAIEILDNGTPQAKKLMREQLDFYFEDGVQSADGIKKWLAENPDDSGDEEFYGGEKPE